MAVVSISELFEGRTGEDTFTRRRTYKRVFEALTDSDDDNAFTVGSYSGLPRLGNAYPGDAFALCVGVDPTQDSNSPRRWLVDFKYDTQPDLKQAAKQQPNTAGSTDPNLPENPLDRPPVWKFNFQQLTRPVRNAFKKNRDTDRNIGGTVPLTNSAGFMFDPPVTNEESRPIIQVTFNQAVLNMSQIVEIQDTVNLNPWRGFDPFQVRCIGCEGDSHIENGVSFWQLTYHFAVNYDTWICKVLDAGTWERVKIGDNPFTGNPIFELTPIKSPWNDWITEPVPLNGAGRQLPVGNPEVYLRYSIYRQRDFLTLLGF